MAKDVRVILLEDVGELGRAGDIVTVSEGYARNSLFPDGLAALATDHEVEAVSARKRQQTEKEQAALAQLQEQAEQLTGTELTLTAQVKDGDEIFGSITAATIAKELNQQAGTAIKAKDIQLDEPLHKLGSHDVAVNLGQDVETTIRVTIVADPASSAAKKEDEV